jgi:formiminotetrahydrofolate cyclodeaminase
MPSLTSLTVTELLDAFASNTPLPAGGSAAALASAAGASLLVMVATLPTKRSRPEDAALRADAAARLRPVRDAIIELIDRDSDAYARLLAAFRLPAATDQDSAGRREAIDAAMRGATEAPLDLMRACRAALRSAVVVAAHGPAAAVADVGAAVELLYAGLRAAGGAIDSNLDALRDDEYAGPRRAERLRLESESAEEVSRARAVIVRPR